MFEPYHKPLGTPPNQRRPTRYQFLGVHPSEAATAPVAVSGAATAPEFEGLADTEPAGPRRRRVRKGSSPYAAATAVLLLAATTVGLAVWGSAAPRTAPSTSPAATPDTKKTPRAGTAAGEVRRFGGKLPAVHAVAFSPDGRYALSGGEVASGGGAEGCALRLWELDGGKEIGRYRGHEAPVWCVAFSPDGRYALSGAGVFSRGIGEVAPADCTLRLWDVAGGKEVRRFEGHTGPVRGVAFLPGGYALSCAADGSVRAWETATGREVGRLDAAVPLRYMAVSPDGGRVVAGGEDGVARLWQLRGRRELARFEHGEGPVTAVAFAPDGRQVLTAGCRPRPGAPPKQSMEWSLRMWGVERGVAVRTFPAGTSPIRGLSFSPDGRWAVSGAFDGGVHLWDVAAGREARSLAAHRAAVGGVAISPDGGRVLSGAADGALCLWALPRASAAVARR